MSQILHPTNSPDITITDAVGTVGTAYCGLRTGYKTWTQDSVRVKINEYVYAWSEFLFVSLLVILNFFPKITHFYYSTSLHGLQDVENH